MSATRVCERERGVGACLRAGEGACLREGEGVGDGFLRGGRESTSVVCERGLGGCLREGCVCERGVSAGVCERGVSAADPNLN